MYLGPDFEWLFDVSPKKKSTQNRIFLIVLKRSENYVHNVSYAHPMVVPIYIANAWTQKYIFLDS